MFCMSGNWLHDDDTAIISVFISEIHVLQDALHPDKKGGGVSCLINKLLLSEKQHTKIFKY